MLSEREFSLIDKVIAKLGRLAMRGAACDKDVVGHPVTLPAKEEMQLRRLGWAQRWAMGPDNHDLELAVMFGRLRGAEQVGGGIEKVHPWRRQLEADVRHLLDVSEEARESLQALDDAEGYDLLELCANKERTSWRSTSRCCELRG